MSNVVKVRNHRLRIREEGDQHPQYGLASEEKLKILLSEANLASAANVTGINTSAKASRTRQKFQEVQAMEQQLELQGKIAPSSGHATEAPVAATAQSKAVNSLSPGATTGTKTGPGIPPDETAKQTPALVVPSADAPIVASPTSGDKWLTDIFPNVKPGAAIVRNPTEPTPVQAPAKLPEFTSSFLGKAIDLDKASPVTVAKKSYLRAPPEESTPTEAHKQEYGEAVVEKTKVTKLVSEVSASHATSNEARKAPTAPASSGLGRKPPPPSAPVSSGLQDAPVPRQYRTGTPHAATREVDSEPGSEHDSRDSDEEDAGQGEVEGHSDKLHSENAYRRAADEIELPPAREASAKIHPLRNVPLPGAGVAVRPHRPDSSETATRLHVQPPQAAKATLSRGDSANEDELVGFFDLSELQTEDDTADGDYGHLYGTRRRAATEAEDEDLEELSPTRTATHSGRNSADLQELASGVASPIPTEHTLHMPSIDEGDETLGDGRSRREVSVPAVHTKVERRLDYVTVDPLRESPEDEYGDPDGERDDAGEGDGEGEIGASDAQEGLEGDDTDLDREADEKTQIRVLRSHAKVLEGLKDIPAAEGVHMRALELDPTNITTLEGFAIFLHQKKGELARAEAFFNRGLQICLPGLSLRGSANNTPKSTAKSQSGLSFGTDATMQGNKVSHIVRFVMSYAHFMSKSKGDIEAASILYRKGVDLAPENAFLLATYAHFLAQLGDKESSDAAMDYFQRALKLSPGNGQYCLWYGKLLKRLGKVSQAELMYKVALERCKGSETLEPTAICNYATFVFKQRHDPARAQAMFKAGLAAFPQHKGLRKNYATLVKTCPEFAGDLPSAGAGRERNRGAERAERLARNAETALRGEGVSPVGSELEVQEPLTAGM
jgi:Tfp pilus assembly protein PilF